ncbi:hypothetical protein GCM10010341_91050 [Streptomyces noursei]|nr:hypothetical protein GCM10010341_91050 [Streptomyces noursei]
MLTVVNEDGTTPSGSSLLDEVVREGARRMLAAALEAEVNAYIAELTDERDARGRRLVVRNGYHQPRQVTTAAGVVEVKAPRVNDKRVDEQTGERRRFSSAILPPWCRKSPKISEVLPLLYLHGLSSGDFVPALEQFLGSSAGLSAATVTRLTTQWQSDHAAFMDRDLSEVDYVYVWADGIHLNVRLEEAKACVLVLIGVRADGSKGHCHVVLGPWDDLAVDRLGEGSAVESAAPSYKGHRYPVEIISHCVWLYFRFPLSFREALSRSHLGRVPLSRNRHRLPHQSCGRLGDGRPHEDLSHIGCTRYGGPEHRPRRRLHISFRSRQSIHVSGTSS